MFYKFSHWFPSEAYLVQSIRKGGSSSQLPINGASYSTKLRVKKKLKLKWSSDMPFNCDYCRVILFWILIIFCSLIKKTQSKIIFIALYWQNWENVVSFLVNHQSLQNALAHYTHKCKKCSYLPYALSLFFTTFFQWIITIFTTIF